MIQLTLFKAIQIKTMNYFFPQPINSKGSYLVLKLVWKRQESCTSLVVLIPEDSQV